jgi:hypothetical protein
MAKAPDPRIIDILRTYDEDPKEALWDCHGVWVVYHKAIERIAAKAGITFDMPEVVEAKSAEKIAVIIARGFMSERSEWSFGEAAPNNNKNSYPYAMAEKRAKDRVVLKLVGLHGLAYSEEESDDFKGEPEKPKRQVGINPQTGMATAHALKKDDGPDNWQSFQRELLECQTVPAVAKLAMAWSSVAERDKWPTQWRDLAKEELNKRREIILNGPPDDDFPGDRPSINGNSYANNYSAG